MARAGFGTSDEVGPHSETGSPLDPLVDHSGDCAFDRVVPVSWTCPGPLKAFPLFPFPFFLFFLGPVAGRSSSDIAHRAPSEVTPFTSTVPPSGFPGQGAPSESPKDVVRFGVPWVLSLEGMAPRRLPGQWPVCMPWPANLRGQHWFYRHRFSQQGDLHQGSCR